MTPAEELIDTLKSIRNDHIREKHTPEYEVYLRTIPPKPWGPIPPKRLQVSNCEFCQVLFNIMMDCVELSLPAPFTIKGSSIDSR